MTHLVRFLASPLWIEYDSTTIDVSVVAPEILFDVSKKIKKGTSYWQAAYDGKESLARIIAAYAATQEQFADIVVGVVPLSEIEALGIEIQITVPDQRPDEDLAQHHHRDLIFKSAHEAIQVAELIRRTRHDIVAKDIRRYLRESVEQNFIRLSKLSSKLILKLNSENGLMLAPPPLPPPAAAAPNP